MKKLETCLLFLLLGLFPAVVAAQTTAFTYQGSLKEGGAPANGNYDFEFRLYDALANGSQIGTTLPRLNVPVANGVFTVQLDFGAAFSGANRFLEIRVGPAGGNIFIMSPRQSVASAPYSIKSLTAATTDNALALGGIPAAQYVTTTGGGANFIQNSTGLQTGNFNISGNGTAGGTLSGLYVNAGFGYLLGSQPFLSALATNSSFGTETGPVNLGASNTYAGYRAGNAGTSNALNNSFFGANAGRSNTNGSSNSFFGVGSGELNTFGGFNAFFGNTTGAANTNGSRNTFAGVTAGRDNTSGSDNTFVGMAAGQRNLSGGDNSFFGTTAGAFNQTGAFNSFVGRNAGGANTTGSSNAFFGASAGAGVVDGSSNTMLGAYANGATASLSFATAVGSYAQAGANNSLVLGAIGGTGGCQANIGCETVKVGIGTTAPAFRLDVADRVRIKQNPADTGANNSAGIWFFQNGPNTERAFVGMENDGSVGLYGNNGGGWSLVMNTQTGVVSVRNLGAAGATALCRNASNELATCSSSRRYKTNIEPYAPGLDLIRRLRPVAFDWRANDQRDFGLVAEEVAEVEPLLTIENEKGETEGVKYDRVAVVAVNAINEQQAEIETLQKKLAEQTELVKKQQAEIDALKQFVCTQNPQLALCR
ncbi:MAG: tail fiber domain-containing protein [Acidobacteria bacterium]|nr:tail fiber domain-containing protein [Acidobacteriota bacterium]